MLSHTEQINVNVSAALFLTDDRVDALGRVLPERADAGALGGHGEAGERPLAVHVLTDDGPHLPDPRQPAERQRGGVFRGERRRRRAAVGGVLRRAAVQFGVLQGEDVDGSFVAGGAQEGRVVAEVDAGRRADVQEDVMAPPLGEELNSRLKLVPVEGGGVGSSPQLHQLVSGGGVEEPDERSFARRRGRHAARLVERHAGDLALVGVDGEGGGGRAGFGVGQVLEQTEGFSLG